MNVEGSHARLVFGISNSSETEKRLTHVDVTFHILLSPVQRNERVGSVPSLLDFVKGQRGLRQLSSFVFDDLPNNRRCLEITFSLVFPPEYCEEIRMISEGSSSLTNDLILQVFSYLDALTLTKVRLVSDEWKILSDSSPVWSSLCQTLWETKQNHPYERWVRVEVESDSQDEIFRHQLEFLLLRLLMEGGCHSQEIDTMLVLLKFIRISSKKMQATPISHWVRAQQIQLETELLKASQTLEGTRRLKERISANIRQPARATEFQLSSLKEKGLLLSWRDSYIASFIDSSRTRITHEVT